MSPDLRAVVRYPRRLVFPEPSLPVSSATVVLDGDHEVHSHDFLEIAIVRGGSGSHEGLHGRVALRRGSLVVVRPGAWHGYTSCKNLEVTNLCIGLDLLAGDLRWLRADSATSRLLWSAAPGRGRGPVALRLGEEALCAAEAAASDLAAAVDADQAARRPAVIGALLVALSRLAGGAGANGAPAGATGSPHVLAVLDLFEDTRRAWRMRDLAERVHVGPAHLSKLFRRDVGMAPMAYLARLRAERAAALLCEADDPITAVGAAVGWPDPSYFARMFRARYGCSPRQYRAQARSAALAGPHA